MSIKVCPQLVIDQCASRIKECLEELSNEASLKNLVVGFVNQSGELSFSSHIKCGAVWTVDALWNKGTCGYALRQGRIISYPEDESLVEHHRITVGPKRIKYEIVCPISYCGRRTGVLMAYVYEDDPEPIDIKMTRLAIDRVKVKIEDILNESSHSEQTIRNEIDVLLKKAIESTQSARGYVALLRGDGGLDYFTEASEEFLELSAFDGLCGLAIRTGKRINVQNVWTHPEYVASDPDVRSELVIPLIRDEQVIGVLNLESYAEDNYTPTRTRVLDTEIVPELDRVKDKYADVGIILSPVSGLLQQAFRQTSSAEEKNFYQTMNGHLLRIFKFPVDVWVGEKEQRPLTFPKIEWNSRSNVIYANDKDFVHASVSVHGSRRAMYGIHVPKEDSVRVSQDLQLICRILGEILASNHRTEPVNAFERLITSVLDSRDSLALELLPGSVKRMLNADFCSVYAKVRINDQDYMLPLSSSEPDTEKHDHAPRFYKIGLQPDGFYDGLTGYTASTGVDFVVPHLGQAPWETLAKAGIRWKKGMSESGSDPIAAFLCHAIKDTSGNVIGIVRVTKRQAKGSSGAFDESSLRRLRAVTEILGMVFEKTGLVAGLIERPKSVSGRETLDDSGKGLISLPGYFRGSNQGNRLEIAIDGEFGEEIQIKVSERSVYTLKAGPNVQVAWRVEELRAKPNRLPNPPSSS